MGPRLIALVLAALLAGCGGNDWPDEAEATATKPATPNCSQPGACT